MKGIKLCAAAGIFALFAGLSIAQAQYENNGEGTYEDNNGFGYAMSAEYKQGFDEGYQAEMKKNKKSQPTPIYHERTVDSPDSYEGGYDDGKAAARKDLGKAQ